MGYPYPVDLFSNRELTRYSSSKTVVDFLRQGNVIGAIPDLAAVVEPEYLVDLIAIARLHKINSLSAGGVLLTTQCRRIPMGCSGRERR